MKSLFILSAALALCVGCGVRGALKPAASAAAAPTVPQGGAVLVGADGKTVTVTPAKDSTIPK